MAGAYVPPQTSETPDHPVEDCAPSSDLMAANKATLGAVPSDRTERERIRTATGKPHGGLTIHDLNVANLRLFGHRLEILSIPFARFIVDHMDHGDGAVLMGSASRLPAHYNRWDPAFGRKPNSGHAVYVQADGPTGRRPDHLWWMNPLAPWSYQGEWIPVADVRAYAWTIGQSGIVGQGAWTTVQAPPVEVVPVTGFTLLPGPSGSVQVHGGNHSTLRLADNHLIGNIPDGQVYSIAHPIRLDADIAPGAGDRRTAYLIGGEAHAILAQDVTFTPTPSPVDCSAEVAQATGVLNDRIRAAKLALG